MAWRGVGEGLGAFWRSLAVLAAVFLWSSLASPCMGQAAGPDLSGLYLVEGANPDGQGRYRGDVKVERAGDAYSILWTINGQRHIGTGIYRDGKLAVVYQPKQGLPGIAFYEVRPGGQLIGLWVPLSGRQLGSERWTPKDRS
jgi:hypothetical protein